jgi:superfamily II DNA or RNA helicase
VSALLPLRNYQRGALDGLMEGWTTEGRYRLAVVLPTGGGKTVCFAHLAKEHLDQHPGERVVVLVHTDELVSQAYNKIKMVAPHLEVGIVKASRNDVRAHIIVASVQSLRSAKRRAQILRVGLVIVDECHHATARTYRTILEDFGCFGGRVRAAGFTATLERGDGGPLGEIWQDVAFQRDIAWMIRRKYLINVHGKVVQVPDLDLASVKSTRADYREGELGDALADSLAPELVAKAYAEHAHDRTGIAFFPTVASAYVFRDAFVAQGITCEVIHGALPIEERRDILARFEAGKIQVIANCMVLTEGFDSPKVSCIVVGRPTKSKPLYIQMVGRGLRVDPMRPYEEQDCLILDVTGVSAMHDLRSLADLSDKPVKKPREGQTLLDLEDEFDSGEGVEQDPEHFYVGPVEVKEFDPLKAKSSRAWNHTAKGTPFLSAGKEAYVFLVPGAEPGSWTVAWSTKSSTTRRYACGPDRIPAAYCQCGRSCSGRPGDLTEHRDMALEMAMAWAEDLAVDMGADAEGFSRKKKAPWRKAPAKPAAKDYARTLGIKFPEDIRGGELSDQIDKIIASRRIDPIVAVLNRARENWTTKASVTA